MDFRVHDLTCTNGMHMHQSALHLTATCSHLIFSHCAADSQVLSQSLALLQWLTPDLVLRACRLARLVLQRKAVAGAAAARCALLAPHQGLWLGTALLRAGAPPPQLAQIPAHRHRQVLSMLCVTSGIKSTLNAR